MNNHSVISFFMYIVPSGPPRNLATTTVTSRSISLTWDPPTAANQNGNIRSYIIIMTVLETQETIQLMSNSTEIDLEMLRPYYTYSFVISAVTIGPGPLSTAYNVTTEHEGSLSFCIKKVIHLCQSKLLTTAHTHASLNTSL